MEGIRQMMEGRELELLQPYAALSIHAVRDIEEEPCPMRTAYQRDRDRILHSKSFRRLKDKTQVFLAAEGDHYRTRLTHTLEVSQAARTIAKALRLNEELTEAIGLGHDLGHTPFGHTGEAALNAAMKWNDPNSPGFYHNKHSLRVVEVLEKEGRGLNLTKTVRDGILNHGTAGHPATLEGQVVRLCDKIAYINHDIDDAIRAGVLQEAELPEEYTNVLGHSVRERLNTLISDVIYSSQDKDHIEQSEDIAKAMVGLRAFMFERVYMNPGVKQEERKAQKMLTTLFEYYMDHPDSLPKEYKAYLDSGIEKAQVVCDYIAGMTDRYAIHQFETLFVPVGWHIR